MNPLVDTDRGSTLHLFYVPLGFTALGTACAADDWHPWDPDDPEIPIPYVITPVQNLIEGMDL